MKTPKYIMLQFLNNECLTQTFCSEILPGKRTIWQNVTEDGNASLIH